MSFFAEYKAKSNKKELNKKITVEKLGKVGKKKANKIMQKRNISYSKIARYIFCNQLELEKK